MAKESKKMKIYTEYVDFDQAVKAYECFGWEMLQSDKMSYSEKISHLDGTFHYETHEYYEVMFTRERARSWYSEVVELEQQYEDLKKQELEIRRQRPVRPTFPVWGYLLYLLYVIPGILYRKSYKKKVKAYEQALANDSSNSKLQEIAIKKKSILDKAFQLTSSF